jgi:hypothetical protein
MRRTDSDNSVVLVAAGAVRVTMIQNPFVGRNLSIAEGLFWSLATAAINHAHNLCSSYRRVNNFWPTKSQIYKIIFAATITTRD